MAFVLQHNYEKARDIFTTTISRLQFTTHIAYGAVNLILTSARVAKNTKTCNLYHRNHTGIAVI